MAGEHGSATLQVLGLVMVLLTAAVGVAGFGGLAAAKHRATTAADMAALAAAAGGGGAVPSWPGSPGHAAAPGSVCAAALTTAAANGARLTSCVPDGADVTVTVEVVAEVPLGLRHTLTARARAGPAR